MLCILLKYRTTCQTRTVRTFFAMSSCSDIPTLSGSRLEQSLALCPHESYNPASSGFKLHGKKHAMPWCCLSTSTLKASQWTLSEGRFSTYMSKAQDALCISGFQCSTRTEK